MFQPQASSKLTPRSLNLSPMKACFGHIFLILTPTSAILAITRSLYHAVQLFQLIQIYLFCFMYCSLFCAYFACVIVQMKCRSREIKSNSLKKSNNSLARKASGILPLYISFCPNNSMIIHFIVELHKFDGTPIKNLPSLLPQNLEHRV